MNILFLVSTYFPQGVAFSSRAVSLCRLLSSMDCNVHVIAMRCKDPNVMPSEVYSFEKCTYECATRSAESALETYVGNKAFYECVCSYLKGHSVDAVLTSACPLDFLKIEKLCHRLGIPLYLEQCEWYDSSNFTFGKYDPRYRRIMRLIDHGYCKADGIVAISKLFERHYQAKSVPVVRIPTILDVKNIKWRATANNDKKIQIVYTGSCGVSKEFLRPIVAALASETVLHESFVFHIYGPNRKTVFLNIGEDTGLLQQAGESVVIHGNVPQTQIQQILTDADYQMFIRPDRRSSNAGFPTKLGESMRVGTPVITNDTGDIGLYLQDGENGYMLKDQSTKAVKEVLYRILESTVEMRSQMRCAARKTAEKAFDYRSYLSEIKTLLRKGG